MKKSSLKLTVAVAALLSLSSLAVMAAPKDPGAADRSTLASETYKALNLFGDVFEQVRANYVEPVEDRKLIEYALNGMLSSLDPHSSYMNDDEAKSMNIQNKGEFGGLGIEVTMENGVIKVVSPIDDTPAARAGMQAGDLIVEIDGKPVMGMTLNDAVDKMRGKVGTDILLTVVRQGVKTPIKQKITRDTIQIKSVKSRIEKGNVGYIRITTFNAQTSPGLKKAFEDIKKEAGDKLIGYVIDLRNNPGGLLDQAIAVSDAFLEKGEIVSTRGRSPDDTRRDNATPGDMSGGLPLVVVINGGSASASEIVAGALQDHNRAIVVGTQSFGKGSVQTLFSAPGGGMVRLTTARYYTPSGRSIQAKGITPDILIEPAKVVTEDKTNGFGEIHEADLKGALKNPDGSDATPAPADAAKPDDAAKDKDSKADDKGKKKDDPSQNDYQLQRAVDLLQGISLYGKAGESRPPVKPDEEKETPKGSNK